MKHIIIVFISFLSCYCIVFAQDSWHIITDINDGQIRNSEMVLSGSNIYTAGYIDGVNSEKPYVSKFELDGTLIWSAEIDVPFSGWVTDMKVVNDEIYIAGQWFAVATLDDDRNIFLLKMDTDANLIWSKNHIGENWTFSNDNRFIINDMQIDENDGSIFFCGGVTQPSATILSYHLDPIYGALDASQNLVWCKRIEMETGTRNVANGIYKRGQNEFLLLGSSSAYVSEDSTNYSFDNSDAFIASIDVSGNLNYINSYDKIDDFETGNFYTDIIPSEGSYYAIGQVSPYLCDEGCTNGLITKFDIDGDVLWSKIVSRLGGEFNDITAFTNDGEGGLLLATAHYGFFGIPPFLYSPAEALISQMNSSGDIVSAFLLNHDDNDIIRAIEQDNDNQVYFSGLKEEAISSIETTRTHHMGRILSTAETCDFISDEIYSSDYPLSVIIQQTNSTNYTSVQLSGPGINVLTIDVTETCRETFSYMAIDGEYFYTETCPIATVDLLENDLFIDNVNVTEVNSLNGATGFSLDGNLLLWEAAALGDEAIFQYIACDASNFCDTALISISQTMCPLGPPLQYFQDTLTVVPGEPLFIPINCELVEVTDTPSNIILGIPAQDGFFIDPAVDFTGVDMFSYTISFPDTCCPLVCEVHDVFIIGPSHINLVEGGISIFPNPAMSILNVDVRYPSEYSFQLTDLKGREIIKTEALSKIIDVSNLRSGVYFVRVSSGENVFVQKLIIN